MSSAGSCPAKIGSLKPEVVDDLRVLIAFMNGRDEAFTRALGYRVKRNPVMDEIVRQMMVAFGVGQLLHVRHYQMSLSFLASRNAIRSEVCHLADLGALLLYKDASDRRALIVHPTQRLVEFYNQIMPPLRDEAASLLCRAQQQTEGYELWADGVFL